jgi:glutamate synthase (NADPH/NADH) small chain
MLVLQPKFKYPSVIFSSKPVKSKSKINLEKFFVPIDGKFEPVANSEKIISAELVFLALGFTGPEKTELLTQLEVDLDDRGNIARDENYATSADGVFVCGDAGRGQSLIVWAIAEGRSAASSVDIYLTGNTQLPFPIEPTARPLMV